jgi:hypothetical protein
MRNLGSSRLVLILVAVMANQNSMKDAISCNFIEFWNRPQAWPITLDKMTKVKIIGDQSLSNA